MIDEKLLIASQAGEALGASSQSIRNWIRGRRLHAVRIGNQFLIPRSEVDRAAGECAWERRREPVGVRPGRAG